MAKINNTKEPIKDFKAMNPQDIGLQPLKFKRLHPDAVIPSYSKPGDAGLDLTCVDSYTKDGLWCCEIGLAVEIPQGYFGAIYPRSSISKTGLRLCNSVGVIDSGYRGPIFAFFDIISNEPWLYRVYRKGERCCQLIIQKYEQVFPIEVEELSETERGQGGFGHTGK